MLRLDTLFNNNGVDPDKIISDVHGRVDVCCSLTWCDIMSLQQHTMLRS